MKQLFLTILLLSCASLAFSQSTEKKSSIFIGLGPSIPVGDFSSKNASDDKDGLAATGFHVDLGYQYQFLKNVGAIAMINGRTCGVAKDALFYSLPDGSGGSASTSATTWRMASVLAGLTQTFALSKDEAFSIEFREAAGIQFTSSPEVGVNFTIPGFGSASAELESQSATSFAYLLGLGFKYQLSSNLGLKLYGDFNNSNAKFKEYTVNNGGTAVTAPASNQKTGTIDLGLGLIIGF